jgi:hypothetical protein
MSENEKELTAEGIEAQQVVDLPAREAMSVITPFLGAPGARPIPQTKEGSHLPSFALACRVSWMA